VGDTHKVTNPQISLNLSQLGTSGRLALIALITKFAPTSTQYAGNPTYKAAVDKVVAHTATLGAAEDGAEAAKKAATVAIVARDTEIAATDGDLNVLKAVGETLFKTEADFHNNGFNRRVRSPPAALVAPGTVTAAPGKKAKGTIVAHALKIAGLYKYICAVSTDPTSTGTYAVLNGTAALRTISGLVSGQGYWIKYCTERGSVRSDWSAPVYCLAS
jgi:hypothetical protein